MALNFKKKSKTKKTNESTKSGPDTPTKKGKGKGFLLTGEAAGKAQAKETILAAQRKAQRENNVFRFWIPDGAETEITFLDGDLDADGVIDAPMFYEHQLKLAGSWQNWFVCLQTVGEPCPICEQGDQSKLVTVFTIIDHSSYKNKKDVMIKDTVKLFVCKQETIKHLQKLATKRGGLAGVTFDVSRAGDNAANVGNIFDFTEKRTLKELQKVYGGKDKTIVPCDYQKVIAYKSEGDLRDMGFGDSVVGSEANYDDEL